VRHSFPSAAPKRDHDEWLVRRRLGGAGSPAPGPSLNRLAQPSFLLSRARPRPPVRHGRETCSRPTTSPSGWTACAETSEGGNTVVDLDCGDKVRVGRAVRQGRQRPGTPFRRSPKSRSAGEARASYIVADYPREEQASPAPLHLPSNPRPHGRRGCWLVRRLVPAFTSKSNSVRRPLPRSNAAA
jgi:hypothetical protein